MQQFINATTLLRLGYLFVVVAWCVVRHLGGFTTFITNSVGAAVTAGGYYGSARIVTEVGAYPLTETVFCHELMDLAPMLEPTVGVSRVMQLPDCMWVCATTVHGETMCVLGAHKLSTA